MNHTTEPEATALARALEVAGLDWIVPAWPAPAQVGALATTRRGGVSVGPAAACNLGLAGALAGDVDTPAAVEQNRRRLTSFLPRPPVWLRQVHGRDVVVFDGKNHATALADPPVADAAVTATPGIVCAVLTADCLPVLFADRRGRCVGVAHAGWRGLAAGVLATTVDALTHLGAPAPDLVAWLGPAIGPQAFEVGRDVLDAFVTIDPGTGESFLPHPQHADKWLADLYGLARRALGAAGVGEVHGGSHCTFQDNDRFYSYRRERTTGRMASLTWLRPVAPRGRL